MMRIHMKVTGLAAFLSIFALVVLWLLNNQLAGNPSVTSSDSNTASLTLSLNYDEMNELDELLIRGDVFTGFMVEELRNTFVINSLVAARKIAVFKLYEKDCVSKDIGLDNFYEVVNRWSKTKISSCRSAYSLFTALFYFRKSDSEVVLSQTFSHKVLRWFDNNQDLLEKTKHQFIFVIMNHYTKDGTLINPLRNKRPGFGGGPDAEKYVNKLVQGSQASCDFCNFESQTGKDSFGYLESKYSVTVANTFKIERFHSLVLWKHHNPLEFNEEQFLDLMALSQMWFQKSFDLDKTFQFPSLLWDILPKASASQIHPHVHVFLSKDHYFSGWEKIFRAALEYKEKNGRNYFNDLIKIHSTLKLNISYGDAVGFVSLTPSASNEVVIMSKAPGDSLFKLFYRIMKGFIKMKLYAISAGAIFPPMNPELEYLKMEIPCIIRIVYRGAIDKMRSDISSMELFGSGNINIDFWEFRNRIINMFEK